MSDRIAQGAIKLYMEAELDPIFHEGSMDTDQEGPRIKRWRVAPMSLIESAKLNGHDAWAYLKNILTKLPTWPNSRLAE